MKGRILKVVVAALLGLASHLAHAGTHHYYYTDSQGTVLAKADASGTIIATYDYAPYGVAVASMSQAPNGTGYTGHVNDPESGFVYMQARYYDPSVGRFLSADPVGPSPGSLFHFNRSDYANNNPIANVDPDGLSSTNDVCMGSMQCIATGGDGGGSAAGGGSGNSGKSNIPAGTPQSMKRYFVGISTSDRINAAIGVMKYYGIDYSGMKIYYRADIFARADTLKDGPNGDGQLTLGPSLFKLSFGYIGAVLSHEVEGHWQKQFKYPGMPARDDQSRYMREVQAYRVELSAPNQRRFGLTPGEVKVEEGMLNANYNALTPGNKGMVNQGIYKQL